MSKLNLKTSPTVLFSQVEAVTNMSTLIGRMNGRNSIDRCDALCALNKINGGVLVQTTCTPRESSCYECLLVWHATSSLVIVLFVFSLCGILCTTNAPGMPPGHYTLHGSVPSWPCMELGEWVRPVWESEQSVQSVHSGRYLFLSCIFVEGWITDMCGIICITNVLRNAMEKAELLSASLFLSLWPSLSWCYDYFANMIKTFCTAVGVTIILIQCLTTQLKSNPSYPGFVVSWFYVFFKFNFKFP